MTDAALTRGLDAIEGAVNLRDIGGLAAGERLTRSGILLRSGMMHHITPDGLRILVDEFGVRRVVDLRTEAEHELYGTPRWQDVGAVHHQIQILTTGAAQADEQEREKTRAAFRSGTFSWGPWNLRVATDHAPAFIRALEVLSEPDGTSIVHCTAGRDRTGITVALALALAGVSDDDIADDYARSEGPLLANLHRFKPQMERSEIDEQAFANVLRMNRADIIHMLEGLREEFGTVESYVGQAGMDAETVDSLRHRLTG